VGSLALKVLTTTLVAQGVMSTPAATQGTVSDQPVPVTVSNFIRAESDLYFGRYVQRGGFGKFTHERDMTPLDKQDVVRMNRDTIYSIGVFDLTAAPVTITLPDAGKRFMSMQVVSQDHYTTEVVYAPGRFHYTQEKVGTRYVVLIIRTLANPENPGDMQAAHAAQDAIMVEQARTGTFEVPHWDVQSQEKVRDAISALSPLTGGTAVPRFGTRREVDPVLHLIATATGWGGNPRTAAVYESVFPEANDGTVVHTVTLKDIPVDGFWSISVYNAKGYFEKNAFNAYSLNNLTATPHPDGSCTIQFGGCQPGTANCLPIMAGWNYTVRLYRPRQEVIDGIWRTPVAQPVR
jgi:para-nitrobenzyl esterase